jgi:chromosomal replication initiation ATPase DnaA
MRGGARQLALDLPHAESFRRDDFLETAANAAALALVERWPDWPDTSAAIIGPAGSGKSHLAAIWAERAGARIVAAGALRASAVPAALATGAVAIEDVEAGRVEEPALFHLLNLARQEGAFLLLTARERFDAFSLADLASRLRAIPVVELAPPDDALLAAVLVKLFADRQIAVDEGVISYLIPRMERSLAAASLLVARLDAAALSHGRAVTRALASEVLRED